MLLKKEIAVLLFTVIFAYTHASIGGYIGPADKRKFLETAVKSLLIESDDVTRSYYGAKTFSLLKEPLVRKLQMDNCAQIKSYYKPSKNLEIDYNVFNSWALLECQGKLQTENTIKDLHSALDNDKSSISDIRYALELLVLLKQSIPNPAKVSQRLQTKLKEDDSLQSLGHALHAASLLGDHGKFIKDRVEDIVVQADEIDGKILQWEGGLTTTSLIVTGLLKFANPFTKSQADKIANYLLTRKTVQTPRGVCALLEAATALSNSNVSPVSVTIIGNPYVTLNQPELHVQIGNLFGEPLKPTPTPVVAQSATRITDDVVVMAKQQLTADKNGKEFTLPLKVEPGHYRIALNVGNENAVLFARVLGPVAINSFEIGLVDSDGVAPKLTKLIYPAKLDGKLKAEAGHRLVLKFTLSRLVHQAFVRLHSGKKEIIFVAEADNNKVYKVDANLGQELSSSGSFEIELLLGDSVISNPIKWNLGSMDVDLGAPALSPPNLSSLRGPKPEIKHMFRPAEKRPPEAVSLLFTALTAAPFLLLLILWGAIGVNFKNFTVLALPFHLGFGAILGLFTLFWIKLDMFTTCGWLIPIGGFTFLAGHKLLSHIARNKKPEKGEK